MFERRAPVVVLGALLLAGAAAGAPGAVGAPNGAATGGSSSPTKHGAADEWLRRGVKAFESKRYADAIVAYERSYSAEPRPTTLYALAQAYRLSGDCAAALRYYDGFLASGPDAKARAAAETNRERCGGAAVGAAPAPGSSAAPASSGNASASTSATPPAVPATSATPSPAVSPSVTPSAASQPLGAPRAATAAAPGPRRSAFDDRASNALVLSGLVASALGVAFTVAGNNRINSAGEDRAAAVIDDAEEAKRATTGRRVRATGVVVGVLGLGLIGAGVGRWIALRQSASAWIDDQGAGVRVHGYF